METMEEEMGDIRSNDETSSPLFPRANGKVENAVKIAKQLMEKARKANSDPYLGLLAIRNTPTQGMQSSPAQRLMNRRTRTTLPMHTELLKPALNDNVQNELKETKNREKEYFDRKAKDLAELSPGEIVRIQPDQKGCNWRKAKVIQHLGNRSYLVETEDGRRYRRNRQHLRTVRSESIEWNDNQQEDGNSELDDEGEEEEEQKREDEEDEEEEQAENQQKDDAIGEPYTTRSGRRVRSPVWMRDYQ